MPQPNLYGRQNVIEHFDAKDIEQNKFYAALSYVWILWLVPLLARRQSPFAQFHAKQGMLLFALWLLVSLLFRAPIRWAFAFVITLAAIYALVQAIEGKSFELPLLGKWAKKLRI